MIPNISKIILVPIIIFIYNSSYASANAKIKMISKQDKWERIVSVVGMSDITRTGDKHEILKALRDGASISIINTLINKGFDINAGDFKSRPPICMASRVYKNDTRMVEFLLKNGADPFAFDVNGNSALHRIAKYNPHAPLARIFLELGLDPFMKNKFGKSPVSIAKKNNNTEILSLFLKYKK